MKILPKLKDKLDNAKTIEEKKQIFLDAGIELDDKELEKIDGGTLDIDESEMEKIWKPELIRQREIFR